MSDQNYDLIVVGAGLAGLNAVNEIITDKNIKICLISLPRSKKNNPARLTVLDILENFGIDDCADATYKSFGLRSYHGTEYIHHYDKAVFASLDYNRACLKLEQNINNQGHVDRFFDKVTDIFVKNDRVIVQTSAGENLKGRFLIDASGKSQISKKFNPTPERILFSHNYSQVFKNTVNQDPDEAYFIAPSLDYGSGGGWFYPYGRNRASVGFALITDSPHYPGKEIKQKFSKAIQEISFLKDALKKAIPLTTEAGSIPVEPQETMVFDRIMVLGDAAGQATPWTCMGVEPALENSRMAANHMKYILGKENYELNDLFAYQDEWDRLNRKKYDDMMQFNPKVWFLGEDVWDFIIEKDISSLTPEQFAQRVRHNGYLIPRYKILFKWAAFRLRHAFEWNKYKRYK